jgi:hypothetical protein
MARTTLARCTRNQGKERLRAICSRIGRSLLAMVNSSGLRPRMAVPPVRKPAPGLDCRLPNLEQNLWPGPLGPFPVGDFRDFVRRYSGPRGRVPASPGDLHRCKPVAEKKCKHEPSRRSSLLGSRTGVDVRSCDTDGRLRQVELLGMAPAECPVAAREEHLPRETGILPADQLQGNAVGETCLDAGVVDRNPAGARGHGWRRPRTGVVYVGHGQGSFTSTTALIVPTSRARMNPPSDRTAIRIEHLNCPLVHASIVHRLSPMLTVTIESL